MRDRTIDRVMAGLVGGIVNFIWIWAIFLLAHTVDAFTAGIVFVSGGFAAVGVGLFYLRFICRGGEAQGEEQK